MLRRSGWSAFFDARGVFTLRNSIVMGLFMALAMVLRLVSVDLTPTFRAISFTYLPGAMVGMLFGPWAALAYGFVGDFLLYIVKPQGAYFPGYALSEMLTYFLYACLLYRQPLHYWRVIVARVLIMATVTFGLNYVWQSMLFGATAGGYFTGVRLINNLVQLPFHAILITVLGQQVRKIGRKFRF